MKSEKSEKVYTDLILIRVSKNFTVMSYTGVAVQAIEL